MKGGRRVVVIGSGAAGLAAALEATSRGADVVVLEQDELLGGTTALSGGVVWAPGHPWTPGDRAEHALAYLGELATGDVDAELMAAFTTDASRVMVQLTERTPLRWHVLADWPDYHCELPHGLAGGRCIWPEPLTVPEPIARRVRRPLEHTDGRPAVPADDGVVFRGPVRGHTLVAGLLMALVDLGVVVRTGSRVTDLCMDGAGIAGVMVGDERLAGRVVLATGGFQWDRRLVSTFLPAPGIVPMGTPGCRGDGLRWSMAAGAELGNMAEGWWMPSVHVPDEEIDGQPLWRSLHAERAQPGALLVDGNGRRYVNEAQNYGDVGRAMFRFDAAHHSWPALPSWLVFDAAYRAHFPIGPLRPSDTDPAWLVCAPTLEALAKETGLPGAELAATLTRWNNSVARGEDDEFGRGTSYYDRWIGGTTLGRVDTAPFYAIQATAGCLGTKGGPRTDVQGRVLRPDGSIIAGLFAAGNVAASPFGTATAAGGATLGPALVFGSRAGEGAADA